MAVKQVARGKWKADFRANGKRIIRSTFRTRAEAEAFVAETLRQHRTGNAVDAKAARSVTVASLWEDFRAEVVAHGVRGNRPARPKTIENYDFKWRHYLAPHWEHTPVAALSRDRCRDWVANMTTANDSPATPDGVREGAAVFTRLLDYAMERGLLEYNPMKSRSGKPVPVPARDDARPNVYMTSRQLVRLQSVAGPMSLMVLTAGTTGLRWNEISGLVAGEVDLGDSPRVIIPRSRSKTDAARTIQLPDQVAARLRSAGVAALPKVAPVFPAARGGHWSYSYFMKKFRPVAALTASAIAGLQSALGVDDEVIRTEFGGDPVTMARYGPRTVAAVKQWQANHGRDVTGSVDAPMWASLGFPELSGMRLDPASNGMEDDRDMPAQPTFHDLRHTAVSLAIQAGLNIKLVQQMAGHRTATMTLDTYGHLYPEDIGHAAEAMTGVLSRALS